MTNRIPFMKMDAGQLRERLVKRLAIGNVSYAEERSYVHRIARLTGIKIEQIRTDVYNDLFELQG